MIAGLRAAAYGLPFMPVRGLEGSSLSEVGEFAEVSCPFTGERLYAVPALRPDFALLHVQKADPEGNASILGAPFEDVLLSRAARRVILTAEEIVDAEHLKERPEMVQIPSFLVEAVVEAPGGALPCACPPLYDYDREEIGKVCRLLKEGRWEECLKDGN